MTPDLTAVICTYNRPDLLRRALAAIDAQTYPGTIETLIVFDKSDPDVSLDRDTGNRVVRTMRNTRTSGLPGARNTGITAARADLVALCDDDDAWTPEKSTRQVALFSERPEIDVSFTGMRAMTDNGPTVRIPASDRVTFEMLLAGRIADAHISSTMFRRAPMLEHIGLFDEVIPGGYGEDYEWTLRAARHGDIAVVQEPLVDIRWGVGSYFSDRWSTIADAMEYLVAEFPEFATNPRGLARIEGQQAFARAAAGDRSASWRKIRDVIRHDWRQPRAYLAALVAARLAKPDQVLAFLNRRGFGM